tara:strand:- start:12225 stop:12767 length:543 start_codon:yes stop_codon:yes gene_type:complete
MKHTKMHTPQYVCFDQKTGDIFSIGPSVEPGYQHFEVSEEKIEPIKTYKEKMSDYVVAYDRQQKTFLLRKLAVADIGETFGQVKSKDEVDTFYDVLLTVDKKKKICYITTGLELIDMMKTTNVNLEKQVTFSFTKKGDPHILYDTITFDITSKDKKPININDTFSIFTDSDLANCVYEEI